jgi:hypothetical protein
MSKSNPESTRPSPWSRLHRGALGNVEIDVTRVDLVCVPMLQLRLPKPPTLKNHD